MMKRRDAREAVLCMLFDYSFHSEEKPEELLELYLENYYDESIFNYDSISEVVKEQLLSYDVNTLTGSDLYKFYLYSKATNNSLETLTNYVKSYVTTLEETYNEREEER